MFTVSGYFSAQRSRRRSWVWVPISHFSHFTLHTRHLEISLSLFLALSPTTEDIWICHAWAAGNLAIIAEMFDSVNSRFVTAILFLGAYSALERNFELGVIASTALSFALYWRCNSMISVVFLAADYFLYCSPYKSFSYIPFLLSETYLLCSGPYQKVLSRIYIWSVWSAIAAPFWFRRFQNRFVMTVCCSHPCFDRLISPCTSQFHLLGYFLHTENLLRSI